MKPKPLDLEDLAKIEHEQWIEWSKDIAKNEPISKERIERWKQFWIPYEKLPEKVKEDDRKYARRVMERIKKVCEFWLKYADSPERLLKEREDLINNSEARKIISTAIKSRIGLKIDKSFVVKSVRNYNTWLLKLAFMNNGGETF